ncbi:MAG: hypothetical protein U1E73_05370 [Planctomycetota bacterium]
MALGKRQDEKQQELFVATTHMPKSPGHPFYKRVNELLKSAGFDEWAEKLCEPYYAQGGRPGIPPGVLPHAAGRLLRGSTCSGIAWRCADSRRCRSSSGCFDGGEPPEHSSLTCVWKRLPLELHQEVFALSRRSRRAW